MEVATAIPTKCRTLIVEDDATSRLALSRILEMSGHEVASAGTLQDGMTALGKKPECLILDLMLPDGNGMALLRRIREEGLPIRVVVVTGADKPTIAQAESLHPEAMFVKPVDLRRLIHLLANDD